MIEPERRPKPVWSMPRVRPVILASAAAFALILGESVLAGEEGGQPEPEPRWFQAACKAWDEHAQSQLDALTTMGRLQADEATRLGEMRAAARFHCGDERWDGLLLFASLSRCLREMRSAD